MKYHHIGFTPTDLGREPVKIALLSGEPERSRYIAQNYLQDVKILSEYRGLYSYLGYLANGIPILAATSGIGASSLSIVVNELISVGIEKIIRVGTCGSIQPHVLVGNIVISQAALCRQGAANDIAPLEYPASADPFLTVALVQAARDLTINYHLGITASVDTFYEGQERIASSANPHLLRQLQGVTEDYRNLGILNYEMEAGTLFKMGGVYNFAAGCVCGVVAQRTVGEDLILENKHLAVETAIKVALRAAATIFTD